MTEKSSADIINTASSFWGTREYLCLYLKINMVSITAKITPHSTIRFTIILSSLTSQCNNRVFVCGDS